MKIWILSAVTVLISICSHAAKPGCEYKIINIKEHGLKPFKEAKLLRSSNGVLDVTLRVAYAKNFLAGCELNHRSYNGSLIGPTLRLRPGDKLRVKVINDFPANQKHPKSDDHNSPPHKPNDTNLHTHGLHVSPSGISDNVIIRIKPGNSFQFEIEIPKTHAPGTFWYHPHTHGAVATQVGSGMAGALIIEGGLDEIPEIKAARERTMVLQQISYDKNGKIEDFHESFGSGAWEFMQRQITINGQIVPKISMWPGEVQRWRIVHAGVRAGLKIELEGHKLNEIATDGISMGRCEVWSRIEMYPGYRSDVLVRAKPLPPGKKKAVYYLRDANSQMPLAQIVVEGKPIEMKLPCTGHQLAATAPFRDIKKSEVTGRQRVEYNVSYSPEGKLLYTVNGQPFRHDRVRKLTLGKIEEWLVGTHPDSIEPVHPFHIHVNPFQMVRPGPDGKPAKVWKDTIVVEAGDEPLRLLTRYEQFTGKFVQHCHILDHEDQGMMELLEIVKPYSERKSSARKSNGKRKPSMSHRLPLAH